MGKRSSLVPAACAASGVTSIAAASNAAGTGNRIQCGLAAAVAISRKHKLVGVAGLECRVSGVRDDAQIRLARKTVWQELPGGTVLALGQRTLATERADYALMDIREIDFRETEVAEEQADSAGSQSQETAGG